jgi:hypothetical protein
MSDERTRWSLFHTGHQVVCTECAAPGGLEVRVSYNNLPIAIQRHSSPEDAAQWAEQMRSQWEGVGQAAALAGVGSVSVESGRGVAISDDQRARPFAWDLGNSHTPLNATATPAWSGLQRALTRLFMQPEPQA